MGVIYAVKGINTIYAFYGINTQYAFSGIHRHYFGRCEEFESYENVSEREALAAARAFSGREREAQDLKDSAELLEKSGHHAQSYIESWIDLCTLSCATAGAGCEYADGLHLQSIRGAGHQRIQHRHEEDADE
jgi:hypothetical protein